jgi:XapX domain-containing protein
MSTQLLLALLTGVFAGALFSAVNVPIPAPPNLPGILGIVGIYLGYRVVDWMGYTIDLSGVIAALL